MDCLRCGKDIPDDEQPCEHCGFDNKLWKEAREKLLELIDKVHGRKNILDRVMEFPIKYLKILGYYGEDKKWMRDWIN